MIIKVVSNSKSSYNKIIFWKLYNDYACNDCNDIVVVI